MTGQTGDRPYGKIRTLIILSWITQPGALKRDGRIEYWRNAYLPLLPEVWHVVINKFSLSLTLVYHPYRTSFFIALYFCCVSLG